MNDNNKINLSMLDLFRSEVSIQTDAIRSTLLECDTDTLSCLKKIEKAINALKAATNLVKVDIAYPIIDSLQKIINKLITSESLPHESLNNSLINSTFLLDHISELNADLLSDPNRELSSKIESTLSELTSSTELTTEENQTTLLPETDQQNSESLSIDPGMFALFVTELDNSISNINDNLLLIDNNSDNSIPLEAMMRAAHSVKGAARMIGFDPIVELSHALEDVFVASQKHEISLSRENIDCIFNSTDLLFQITDISSSDASEWSSLNHSEIKSLISMLHSIKNNNSNGILLTEKPQAASIQARPLHAPSANKVKQNFIRVDSQRINNLINLAGELSVSSNWIQDHASSISNIKRYHSDLLSQIEKLRSHIYDNSQSTVEISLINNIQRKAENLRDKLTDQIININSFDKRNSELTWLISHEVISSRMRPFRENSQAYKRLVRDASHALGKQVSIIIEGEDTQVDRDILEKLDAPLNHIIRNAIDHGIETSEQRKLLGKPESGNITISAFHHAGRLRLQVKDDGCGIDIDQLREKILSKKLISADMANMLSKSELLDFLFLPAFSTRDKVTEYSGRGVGLDIVHTALQEIRGNLVVDSEFGQGMSISMDLPLSLSVLRCLLVSLNSELYAFPLTSINSILYINQKQISVLDDKQYITVDNQPVGLIHCSQVLELNITENHPSEVPVIIIGDYSSSFGIVVDSLIGEKSLALRTLDPRLGKIKDISAAAVTDDGDPVLILDTDDLLQSIHDIVSDKKLHKVSSDSTTSSLSYKHVLIVDDSLTVREIEKNLLQSRGYIVDLAVDGADGWNSIRSHNYDLVITDVDMPRMNGIELISLIKNDSALRNIPVMMVSYKDRPEDKQKGLEAGADYYLTKSSFHDETLLNAVTDLIGEAITRN